MRVTLAIALGGAIGAVSRYWFTLSARSVLGSGFPYGTLGVNVLGSVLMGFLTVFLLQRIDVGPIVQAGLLVGVLGSFTTFSTFSLDTLTLVEKSGWGPAVAYVAASVVLSIAGCALGLWLAQES